MLLTPAPLAPPRFQTTGHAQTLWPGIFRKVDGVRFVRERIHTPDDDFLDLDWIRNGHPRVVVLTHGLEGSTASQYIRGTASLFAQHGWDVLAWNCRSCSGEMNRQFRLYYHGDTADISAVVNHALSTQGYTTVALVGFSMGGNITLKYLGTAGDALPPQVRAGVAFSAPCDLESGANILDERSNWVYRTRFMGRLALKVRAKAEQFPGRLDVARLKEVRRWRDFDEWFSAPMCGYPDAEAFYRDSSARYFVEGVRVPTLLASALNDPILTPACFPEDLAREHPFFHLEMPTQGGHCGFLMRGGDPYSWAERRALAFCEEAVSNTF